MKNYLEAKRIVWESILKTVLTAIIVDVSATVGVFYKEGMSRWVIAGIVTLWFLGMCFFISAGIILKIGKKLDALGGNKCSG